MAFVLQDVIKELEETHSLDPVKKLKKKHLVEVAVPFWNNPSYRCNKIPYS